MTRLEENPRLLKLFAWSGPFLVACWIVALVGYGRFIPPKSPGLSAQTITDFYVHHTTALRIDAVILRDKSVPTVLPRWVAYMSIWCACIFVPAGAIIFAKHGPIAYNGLVALYIPLGVFFIWMCGFTIGVMQAIKRDEQQLKAQKLEDERAPSRADTPETVIA